VPEASIPEAFKVLVKEIRSLALDIEPISDKRPEAPAAAPAQVTVDAVEAFADADADDLIGAAQVATDDLVADLDSDKE